MCGMCVACVCQTRESKQERVKARESQAEREWMQERAARKPSDRPSQENRVRGVGIPCDAHKDGWVRVCKTVGKAVRR